MFVRGFIGVHFAPKRELSRCAVTSERADRREARRQRPAGAGTRSPFVALATAPGAGIASHLGIPPVSLQNSKKPVAVFKRQAALVLPLETPNCQIWEGAVSATADRRWSDAPAAKLAASARNAKKCCFISSLQAFRDEEAVEIARRRRAAETDSLKPAG